MAIRMHPTSRLKVYQTFTCGYIINESTMLKIEQGLQDDSIFSALSYLFSNPIDSIISLIAYPFDVYKYMFISQSPYAQQDIKIGKELLKDNNQQNIKADPIDLYETTKKICTFKVDDATSYLDFAPFTKLELYLPFMKIVELDSNVVRGKYVSVYYSIDFNNGMCTAYITASNSRLATDDDPIIYSTTGQIGTEMTFSATNKTEQARNIITTSATAVGGVIASVIAENPTIALSTLAINTGNALIRGSVERIQKGGGSGGNMILNQPNKPYLIITKQNAMPVDYAHEKGRPLMKTMRLGDLVGFTRVTECHLDGFAQATSTELNELTTLLNDGIIL